MLFQIATILLFGFQLHFVWCNDIYSKVIQLLFGVAFYNYDHFYQFQQTDYKIEFTRLERTWYDKGTFKKFEAVTFKYNRTFAVANLTFQFKVQLDKHKFEVSSC